MPRCSPAPTSANSGCGRKNGPSTPPRFTTSLDCPSSMRWRRSFGTAGNSRKEEHRSMSAEFETILQAAIALPVPDRVQLVDALISTLEPEDAAPLDDAWLAEIDRRSREIDAG